MKFAFCTCVQLGLSCIEEIYRIGGKLDLLITLDNNLAKKKSGRIYLDSFANRHNIPLLKIKNINDEVVITTLRGMGIDYLFIIGWSQIAKTVLLNTPNKGCLGMHPSLLPIGRGRAAIPWAIIKGLPKTGVTMFKLVEEVDAGDIIGQIEILIEKDETATTLYQKVNEAHIELISKYYFDIENGNITTIKQDEAEATYWEERKPSDGEIFGYMDTQYVEKLIRALALPYPGAFYYLNNKKIIVREASFSNERLRDISFKLLNGYLNPILYEVENKVL